MAPDAGGGAKAGPEESEVEAVRTLETRTMTEEEAAPREGARSPTGGGGGGGVGTILEAAFVDPAYDWPPADGQGKNAIELQASTALLDTVDPSSAAAHDEDDATSVFSQETTASQKAAMDLPEKPKIKRSTKVTTTTETVTTSRCGVFKCCKSEEQIVSTAHEPDGNYEEEKRRAMEEYETKKASAEKARADHKQKKANRKSARLARKKAKERERRRQARHDRVPEGILLYRLDTSTHTIELMSAPSSNTDLEHLMRKMIVSSAGPANDKSRRGINLVGVDGSRATLVACEQRTAIAWMEAMDMMLSNEGRGGKNRKSAAWADEKLDDEQRDKIEEQYLNLAAYSNNLIRAGAIPGQAKPADKSGKPQGGAGGIYYSIDTATERGEELDEETLESIAKRRAVIRDSWDFYRMICSLLRDRRKYDEVFRRMQLDPVYPYLNSMTGLNDPGDDGYENADKLVLQKDLEEYSDMTRAGVCAELVKRAEEALPSLVEICKALAGSLGMEEVGVGPVKDVSAAIRKAEKKYEGDVLKITDYCRALLVVKDFPTLLALLELARDSFGPLIRRVKLSTLKSDRSSMPGGYRDCKINLELKEHVCEIQVHLWPMWVVCGVDGFRHYRHCLEYSTDSFVDPYDALTGLDRKTMAELIVMAEEAVADMPLDALEWYHEKYILDYFAEVGLFLKHGLAVWAETTLRTLIKLRIESPDIGPDHHETLHLQKYLEQALRQQGKNDEADEIAAKLKEFEKEKNKEKDEANKSLWDSLFVAPGEALDMIMDPNKKEREAEERLKKEVKASKKQWRKIREQRFKFLDANAEGGSAAAPSGAGSGS